MASFSVACILLPNDAIDYGTAGIAILISKMTGYSLSLCVLFVFLPFLIAGIIMLGKYFFAKALIGFNLIVYLAVFVLISRDSAMLSLLVYIIATAIIDHFTDHFEAIKQITIITKDPDRIIRQIKEDLNKTCTIINSSGVIAGENKTLICYVNYFELQKVKTIISENKGTFSTVSTIEEILR